MRFLFLLISFILLWSCSHDRHSIKKIGIQPLGHIQQAALDTLKNNIERYYGFQVRIMPELEMPEAAFVNSKSPRYRADKLLKFLLALKLDSINYCIGVTTKDISTTKRDAWGNVKTPATKYADWGIMGLANCPGKCCVISTFRIQSKDQDVFYRRLIKIALHEIGHNLGLPHCPIKGCVMNDANETIQTIDQENAALCSSCKSKL